MANYGNPLSGQISAYRNYLFALCNLESSYEDCINSMPLREYQREKDWFDNHRAAIHSRIESVKKELRDLEKEYYGQ